MLNTEDRNDDWGWWNELLYSAWDCVEDLNCGAISRISQSAILRVTIPWIWWVNASCSPPDTFSSSSSFNSSTFASSKSSYSSSCSNSATSFARACNKLAPLTVDNTPIVQNGKILDILTGSFISINHYTTWNKHPFRIYSTQNGSMCLSQSFQRNHHGRRIRQWRFHLCTWNR